MPNLRPDSTWVFDGKRARSLRGGTVARCDSARHEMPRKRGDVLSAHGIFRFLRRRSGEGPPKRALALGDGIGQALNRRHTHGGGAQSGGERVGAKHGLAGIFAHVGRGRSLHGTWLGRAASSQQQTPQPQQRDDDEPGRPLSNHEMVRGVYASGEDGAGAASVVANARSLSSNSWTSDSSSNRRGEESGEVASEFSELTKLKLPRGGAWKGELPRRS